METLLALAGMKHRTRADPISSSGEYLIDFHSLEKGQHWMKLNLFASFSHLCSMWKQSCIWFARSTYVPECASACAKHLILLLIINVFHFPLSNRTLCCEITVSPLCELVYKSGCLWLTCKLQLETLDTR
jgi:hypothetical protein